MCCGASPSIDQVLVLQRVDIALTGLVDFGPLGDLRHGDVPPVAAGLGGHDRVGVDDDDMGAVAGRGAGECLLQFGYARDLFGLCAQSAGVGGKVDVGGRGVALYLMSSIWWRSMVSYFINASAIMSSLSRLSTRICLAFS